MAEFYKLLFDLSLYYTLVGYYFRLISGCAPSVAGFAALCLCAALDTLLRLRALPRAVRVLPLFLPLAVLATRPGLWPLLHLLPAWAYVVWSSVTDRVTVRYDSFQERFGFGLKLLPLMVFGVVSPSLRDAVFQTVPYLVVMLTAGVCLLRMLREKRPVGLRQGLFMVLFLLLCGGLTLGRAPQMLVKGLGLLYRNLIAPLFFLLTMALAAVVFVLFTVLRWLVGVLQGNATPLSVDLQGAAEELGLGAQYEAYTGDLRWLRTLLLILAACAVGAGLFLIFRKLLGAPRGANPQTARREGVSALPAAAAERAPGRIRPREPRLAVRYYYAKFVAECARRGLAVPEGMTAQELCAVSAPLFPDADPAALTAVYLPARYQLSRPVPPEDVRTAAAAWKTLRGSAAPESEKARSRRKSS
jgi:hypothetical protein